MSRRSTSPTAAPRSAVPNCAGAVALLLAVAYGVVPLLAPSYLFEAILLPFLAPQPRRRRAQPPHRLLPASSRSARRPSWRSAPSPPTISTCASPGLPLLGQHACLRGLTAAAIGIVFGLPSLRLRGFYLAVSTLAAQFFVQWALTKFGWFSNDSAVGRHLAPPLSRSAASASTAPVGRYLLRADGRDRS